MARLSSRFLVLSASVLVTACGAREALLPGDEASGGASGLPTTTTSSSPSGPGSTGADVTSSSGVTTSTGVTTSSGVTTSITTGVGGGGEGGSPPTGCAPNCTGDHLWSDAFGDNSSQMGLSVATDSTGNILVTGFSNGGVDFGGGELEMGAQNDVVVAKFDPLGNHIWSKRFGQDGGHVGEAIAVDSSDNVIVAGETFEGTIDFGGGPLSGDNGVFVVKLDPSGSHIWSKRFDAETQQSVSAAVDAAGSVILTGSFLGTTSFGGPTLTSAGEHDVFVVKLDASGNHVWSESFGDQYNQLGESVVIDPSGRIVVSGSYLGEPNFGGDTFPASFGGYNIFVAKLDQAGNHVWSKPFGDFGSQTGDAVTTTDNGGNVILAGRTWGMVDFGGGNLLANEDDVFVVKLGADSGEYVWAHLFGGQDIQYATSVAADAGGDIVLVGNFENDIDFGGDNLMSAGSDDVFVAKLDAAGNHLWSKRFGDDNLDSATCVTTDLDDNIVVTGWVRGVVDFGGGGISAAGSGDLYLVKLAP